MTQTKNSMAELGKPIQYHIDENGLQFVKLLENYDISTERPIEEAKRFLLEIVKDEIKAIDVFNLANDRNISKRTLENAKKELGIKSQRRMDNENNPYYVWINPNYKKGEN